MKLTVSSRWFSCFLEFMATNRSLGSSALHLQGVFISF